MHPQKLLLARHFIKYHQELVDGIIDDLRDSTPALKLCSLVSKSWRPRAQKWLFEAVVFNAPPLYANISTVIMGEHTRKLRLIQYPWNVWLEPRVLRQLSPHLSSFCAVTTLSLHSLPLYLFSGDDLMAIFGHFFHTIRRLDLDHPNSTPQGLISFLCRFSAIENLTISSPEWVSSDDEPTFPAEHTPPFTGKLSLSKFQEDSSTFVRLLSEFPINFWSIKVLDCEWDPLPFGYLLRRVSHSLKHFAVSAWSNEHRFVSANLSCCDQLEEVRFFAGMFSPANMPFGKIGATLRSATSRQVKTIVLDLNTNDIFKHSDWRVLSGLEQLDRQLCRVASQAEYAPGCLTVGLSAFDPYPLGSCLSGFRRVGRLVVGTRYNDTNLCICGRLRWIEDY